MGQEDDFSDRRRSDDGRIELIMNSLERLENSVAKMADAIMRLALIEERQQNDRATMQKMDDRIGGLDERVDDLEKQAPITQQTNGWIASAITAAAAALGTLAVTKFLSGGG